MHHIKSFDSDLMFPT